MASAVGHIKALNCDLILASRSISIFYRATPFRRAVCVRPRRANEWNRSRPSI